MFLDRYLTELQTSLASLTDQESAIEGFVARLVECISSGGRILAFGNGGSSATTSHFMADISKYVRLNDGPPVRAICLSDNTPTLTAWANDVSYDVVFSEQVQAHCQTGDVVIAVSCSGNSPNVINGVKQANRMGAHTVGICGFDGGELAKLVQTAIVVPGKRIQQIEDVHHALLHVVSVLIVEPLRSQA
jgi:phosphoheptose isomerase